MPLEDRVHELGQRVGEVGTELAALRGSILVETTKLAGQLGTLQVTLVGRIDEMMTQLRLRSVIFLILLAAVGRADIVGIGSHMIAALPGTKSEQPTFAACVLSPGVHALVKVFVNQ